LGKGLASGVLFKQEKERGYEPSFGNTGRVPGATFLAVERFIHKPVFEYVN